MIDDRYQIEVDEKHTVYEFVSIGPKGDVHKIVKYWILRSKLTPSDCLLI